MKRVNEEDDWLMKWFYEKKIDLSRYLQDTDFETLNKLGLNLEEKQCSEFDFGILLRRVYEYYDFEELENKKQLSSEEESLLEVYRREKEFNEEEVREGYLTQTHKLKNLQNTDVSREEYKELLKKIMTIENKIKLDKKIERLEKKKKKYEKLLKDETDMI